MTRRFASSTEQEIEKLLKQKDSENKRRLTKIAKELFHEYLNPLTPKSAIWHKTPLHAQYLVNLCEICTTKRSWKDLDTEGIKLNPILYET